MNLYIEIENGVTKNHPALENNLIQAFGAIPAHWEPFIRVERPTGIYQVLESNEVVYAKVNGVWTDVWAVRDMTAEEKTAKQQEVIDSLHQELINQQAKQQAVDAENRSKTLETDLNSTKEIVKAGSVLSTGGFYSAGVFARNSGAEAVTEQARKSSMIKTSFTLRENRIVKPGRKTLYLKVIGPNGSTMNGKGGGSFTATGQADTFGASREIDYQGQDTDVSIYFTPTSILDKGTYRLEIYEGGNLIGKSEVILK
jgi:hypothetical protein